MSLLDALARPLSPRGLTVAALAAVPLLLVPVGPGAFWVLASGALLAVAYAMLVAHVAENRPGFPHMRGPASVEPVRRGVAGGFVLYAIGVLPFVTATAMGAAATGDATLARSDVLAAMLVTSLYMPSAIVAVTITGSPLAALWPLSWMRVVGAGPLAYGQLIATFALTTAAIWFSMGATSDALRAVPAVGPYLAGAAVNVLWLVQAALIGAFIRTHARALGMTPEPDAGA